MEDEDSLALFDAARRGDVGFLREALKIHNISSDFRYFLAQTNDTKSNIIHLAFENEACDFIHEAIDKLKPIAPLLICQRDDQGCNSLHYAATKGNLEMVRILVRAYIDNIDKMKASDLSSIIVEEGLAEVLDQPPWLVQCNESDTSGTSSKFTPLHFALSLDHEDVAIYISSLDKRLLTEFYYSGSSAIGFAISKNYGRYVEHILNSGWSYGLELQGQTALHAASLCPEEHMKGAAKLLFKKHPELINKLDDRGESILSYAVSNKAVWFVKLMIMPEESDKGSWVQACRKLIWVKNSAGDTPLHVVAAKGNRNMANLIVDACNSFLDGCLEQPWLVRNSMNNTPFIVALKNKQEEFALYMISLMGDTCAIDTSGADEGALYLAVLEGCEQVSEILLQRYNCALQGPNGQNPLHVVSNCTEHVAKLLVEKYPLLVRKKDNNGIGPLYRASAAGAEWLVRLLLEKDNLLMDDEPLAWKDACIFGYLGVILAFIKLCPNLTSICRDIKDTPFHHVKLQNPQEYKQLLSHQVFKNLKNLQNDKGDTPLHVAIKRLDLVLTEKLLEAHDLDRTISNKDGITALDLLEECYHWNNDLREMCKRINLDPMLQTAYMKRRRNLKDMRSTLSVVAALLATITFAAAFTIPGGFNSNNGEAVLATKTSFLVFILSDAFSMCCSMVVLFFHSWTIIWGEDQESLELINCNFLILQLALGGTVVAFMAGVFTMMSKKSLWIAIITICMCSLAFFIAAIPMYANRTIICKIIKGLIPTSCRRCSGATDCCTNTCRRIKRSKLKV